MPFILYNQYLTPIYKMAEGFPQAQGVWGGLLVVWGDKIICYPCFKGAPQLGFYGHAPPPPPPPDNFHSGGIYGHFFSQP